MKMRLGTRALNLLLACGLGVVLGALIAQRRPSVVSAQTAVPAQVADDGKLRIIIFGAHPDHAEYRGAGVAKKWTKMGHKVKLRCGAGIQALKPAKYHL